VRITAREGAILTFFSPYKW